MTRPTSCRATHDHLTCCRLDHVSEVNGFLVHHAMPHMAADGTQWDEHGGRVMRGNDPYRSER